MMIRQPSSPSRLAVFCSTSTTVPSLTHVRFPRPHPPGLWIIDRSKSLRGRFPVVVRGIIEAGLRHSVIAASPSIPVTTKHMRLVDNCDNCLVSSIGEIGGDMR